MGPVPLPGHPLGLGHVHARLPVPAVDGGQGDRRRRLDPARTCARRPRELGIDRHIRFGHRVVAAAWSSADARWTVEVGAPSRRAEQLTCALPVPVQRLLPLRRRATRPHFPGRERSPGRSCTRRLAGGPRLRRQAGRRHRQRRHGRHAGARAGRARGARDDAAALADVHDRRCPAATRWPTRCATAARRGSATRVARVKNIALHAGLLPVLPQHRDRARKRAAAGQPGVLPDAATPSTRTSPAATTRGTSGCASCPTATSSARSDAGAAEVVTDRIATFTETGVRRRPAGELRRRRARHRHRAELLACGGIAVTVDGERGRAGETVAYRG